MESVNFLAWMGNDLYLISKQIRNGFKKCFVVWLLEDVFCGWVRCKMIYFWKQCGDRKSNIFWNILNFILGKSARWIYRFWMITWICNDLWESYTLLFCRIGIYFLVHFAWIWPNLMMRFEWNLCRKRRFKTKRNECGTLISVLTMQKWKKTVMGKNIGKFSRSLWIM